jgi:hypothetical protein
VHPPVCPVSPVAIAGRAQRLMPDDGRAWLLAVAAPFSRSTSSTCGSSTAFGGSGGERARVCRARGVATRARGVATRGTQQSDVGRTHTYAGRTALPHSTATRGECTCTKGVWAAGRGGCTRTPQNPTESITSGHSARVAASVWPEQADLATLRPYSPSFPNIYEFRLVERVSG